MLRRSMFKIVKQYCFPDVPSSWIRNTVEEILHSQDCFRRKPNLRFPFEVYPKPPKHNDYEADQSSDCNPLSRFRDHPPTTDDDDDDDDDNNYNDNDDDDDDDDDNDDDNYNDNDVVDAIPTSTTTSATKNFYFKVHALFWDHPIIYYENNRPIFLKEGDSFDVISFLRDHNAVDYLLRNNGQKVLLDSLRGKSIYVLCVSVPCFWNHSTVIILRSLITACAQKNINANANADTQMEMVLVPHMKRNWSSDEDAFIHFFSGFPSSWLTIPFSHTLHRHHLCSFIGITRDSPSALLVDSNQKVVFHKSTNFFGSDHFPVFNPSDDDPYDWWKTHTQLDLVLGLDSNCVLNTINNDRTVSISQLKNKVVGVYLCIDGFFIRTLDMISQECKARNQEFEVILVYLPHNKAVNPSLFQAAINSVLHNLNISNWWVLPFDDFVSRRLWEVVYFSWEDELVVFDPHMNIADPFTKSVLEWFGINSYPFTRKSLFLREFNVLKEVTLESLLLYGSSDHHLLRINNDNDFDLVPIAQLRGKNVILYVDNVEKPWPPAYNEMLDWYNWVKTTRVADDFEVVIVSWTPFGSPKLLKKPMPWLVCPFDLEHTKFVSRKTLHSGYIGCIVAFGKDGHIIKLNARSFMEYRGPDGFPPCSNGLRDDINHHFDHHYSIDMNGVFDPPSD